MDLYRRIVAKAPNNVVALNNLAFLASVSSSAPEAAHLTAIERMLQTTGPVDQLLDTKGMLLLRSGDAESAANCFQEAWNQRGETTHLIHLAWAYSELGKTSDAQRLFRLADGTDPPVRLHPLERPLDAAWRIKAAAADVTEQSADLSP
jgi:thioredoxin-like negative regulator of GroEL